MDFRLVSPYQPTGDQPDAIEALVRGVQDGLRHQVLLGATGVCYQAHLSEPLA